MSAASQNARWTFSLRTLFVVLAMTAIVSAWTAHSLNWISERQRYHDDLLLKYTLLEYTELQHVVRTGVRQRSASLNMQTVAPRGLWLFGEQGISRLIVRNPKEIETARRLFPEAVIVGP